MTGTHMHIAFVTSGLYFDPTVKANQRRFLELSKCAHGEIFCTIWEERFRGQTIGNFQLRALHLPRWLAGVGAARSAIRALLYVVFVLGSVAALRLRRKGKPDLLIATDPIKSGSLARIAGRLLGAPYAVELNGNYHASLALSDKAVAPWFVRMRSWLALRIIPSVVQRAGAVKLLYPTQLPPENLARIQGRVCVFHNAVPTQHFRDEHSDDKYVLFLGYPWYLKGVDRLIRAFRQIAAHHPGWTLRVVGFCGSDPQPFRDLADGHPQIDLAPRGIEHSEAIDLINHCSLLVLPSRTEGMGRVLLEAMAASKPVIGARVDGIPTVVTHGHNGLLFDPDSTDDLAGCLDKLMSSQELRRQMGQAGRQEIEGRLSEASYWRQYEMFMKTALESHGRKDRQ
jgi:glycosyltransferase involved in cell wall biosynthesis